MYGRAPYTPGVAGRILDSRNPYPEVAVRPIDLWNPYASAEEQQFADQTLAQVRQSNPLEFKAPVARPDIDAESNPYAPAVAPPPAPGLLDEENPYADAPYARPPYV